MSTSKDPKQHPSLPSEHAKHPPPVQQKKQLHPPPPSTSLISHTKVQHHPPAKLSPPFSSLSPSKGGIHKVSTTNSGTASGDQTTAPDDDETIDLQRVLSFLVHPPVSIAREPFDIRLHVQKIRGTTHQSCRVISTHLAPERTAKIEEHHLQEKQENEDEEKGGSLIAMKKKTHQKILEKEEILSSQLQTILEEAPNWPKVHVAWYEEVDNEIPAFSVHIVEVGISPVALGSGAFRVVHYLVLERPDGDSELFVVKFFKDEGAEDGTEEKGERKNEDIHHRSSSAFVSEYTAKEKCFNDVRIQYEANYFAKLYNQAKPKPPKDVHFLPSAVIQLLIPSENFVSDEKIQKKIFSSLYKKRQDEEKKKGREELGAHHQEVDDFAKISKSGTASSSLLSSSESFVLNESFHLPLSYGHHLQHPEGAETYPGGATDKKGNGERYVQEVLKILESKGVPGAFCRQKWAAVEPFVPGSYTKWSNNINYISSEKRMTPTAFSHFSFEASNRKMMICDIQGVEKEVGYVFTDPQLHGTEHRWGDGDLGREGMRLFFTVHKCNEICRMLGLTPSNAEEAESPFIGEETTFTEGCHVSALQREKEELEEQLRLALQLQKEMKERKKRPPVLSAARTTHPFLETNAEGGKEKDKKERDLEEEKMFSHHLVSDEKGKEIIMKKDNEAEENYHDERHVAEIKHQPALGIHHQQEKEAFSFRPLMKETCELALRMYLPCENGDLNRKPRRKVRSSETENKIFEGVPGVTSVMSGDSMSTPSESTQASRSQLRKRRSHFSSDRVKHLLLPSNENHRRFQIGPIQYYLHAEEDGTANHSEKVPLVPGVTRRHGFPLWGTDVNATVALSCNKSQPKKEEEEDDGTDDHHVEKYLAHAMLPPPGYSMHPLVLESPVTDRTGPAGSFVLNPFPNQIIAVRKSTLLNALFCIDQNPVLFQEVRNVLLPMLYEQQSSTEGVSSVSHGDGKAQLHHLDKSGVPLSHEIDDDKWISAAIGLMREFLISPSLSPHSNRQQSGVQGTDTDNRQESVDNSSDDAFHCQSNSPRVAIFTPLLAQHVLLDPDLYKLQTLLESQGYFYEGYIISDAKVVHVGKIQGTTPQDESSLKKKKNIVKSSDQDARKRECEKIVGGDEEESNNFFVLMLLIYSLDNGKSWVYSYDSRGSSIITVGSGVDDGQFLLSLRIGGTEKLVPQGKGYFPISATILPLSNGFCQQILWEFERTKMNEGGQEQRRNDSPTAICAIGFWQDANGEPIADVINSRQQHDVDHHSGDAKHFKNFAEVTFFFLPTLERYETSLYCGADEVVPRALCYCSLSNRLFVSNLCDDSIFSFHVGLLHLVSKKDYNITMNKIHRDSKREEISTTTVTASRQVFDLSASFLSARSIEVWHCGDVRYNKISCMHVSHQAVGGGVPQPFESGRGSYLPSAILVVGTTEGYVYLWCSCSGQLLSMLPPSYLARPVTDVCLIVKVKREERKLLRETAAHEQQVLVCYVSSENGDLLTWEICNDIDRQQTRRCIEIGKNSSRNTENVPNEKQRQRNEVEGFGRDISAYPSVPRVLKRVYSDEVITAWSACQLNSDAAILFSYDSGVIGITRDENWEAGECED